MNHWKFVDNVSVLDFRDTFNRYKTCVIPTAAEQFIDYESLNQQ